MHLGILFGASLALASGFLPQQPNKVNGYKDQNGVEYIKPKELLYFSSTNGMQAGNPIPAS
jgi:hypothetical protein